MRIGMDGERGFSFGVDDAWQPREPPVIASSRKRREGPNHGPPRVF